MRQRAHLWAVVLAGGEGSRVAHLTTDRRGRTVPKQFWRIRDRGTMLDWTLRRAARHTAPTRVVAVVADRQRLWWQRQLKPLLAENVLSQPENRGTAVALLHAVVQVLLREPAARLLVLPSDHYVEDERVMEQAIARAVRAAETWPEHLVLLGARADRDDSGYGWIVPASGTDGEPLPVERFVEKPDPLAARRLLEQGAVWNTFLLACTGWAFVHALQRAAPDLFRSYMAVLDGGRWETSLARQAYAALPRQEFGHDVLEKVTPSLRLVTLPPCGWTDLGTPERMTRWLARPAGGQRTESEFMMGAAGS
jgi:mannose-1-phosphate guanylyltransferase